MFMLSVFTCYTYFISRSQIPFVVVKMSLFYIIFNNGNIKNGYGICSKVTIKTTEGHHRRHLRFSDVFIVNFEQVSSSWLRTLFCFDNWL